ncbi:MAG TPA: pilus assembly protein TadG-related protein [Planctomycetaceae bacterium]|nr:pilus assembly protein TadG-related protein [Planctomycetaceae bacterium]
MPQFHSAQVRQPGHSRRGAVAILACILLIALLSMLAFSIDLSYLANSQAELQRAADSAALAACYQLIYTGTPGTPVNLSSNIPKVPTSASQYAAYNPVCGSSPSLRSSDVLVGFLANPTQSGGTINTGANQNSFNAVQVTVARNSAINGQVPTFFGKVLGVNGRDASATATAALIANFGGLTVPNTSSGPGNLMLLPFALDQQTWNALLAGDTTVTTDIWKYQNGSVVSGSDGIREVNLFPQGTGSPGNRGTVNIGTCNNSTATVVSQILYGISPAEMAMYPNSQLTFNENGDLFLGANPGISAGFKSALASIVGQTRLIPIFKSVVGNGNNAQYDIVAFAGVRILDVNLTGSMSSKHLTVQPATVYTRGGVPNTSSTTTTSYGVYSPIFLVK